MEEGEPGGGRSTLKDDSMALLARADWRREVVGSPFFIDPVDWVYWVIGFLGLTG